MIAALAWILLCFFVGSLPLSYWLGRIVLHTDIRRYGDGNPGSANVWRAGSKALGLLAVLLDGFKAMIPVLLARYVGGLQGVALGLAAIAPVAGHAFSPFLGFKGGKAIAPMFGSWTGLTLWIGPTILGLGALAGFLVLGSQAWAVMLAVGGLAAYILLVGMPVDLVVAWVGITAILVYKHLAELRSPPAVKDAPLGRRLLKIPERGRKG